MTFSHTIGCILKVELKYTDSFNCKVLEKELILLLVNKYFSNRNQKINE